MNYVKEKLEAVTSHNLEFQDLLDFLESLKPRDQAQIQVLNDFLQKWKNDEQTFSSNLWIVYIRGCWKPSTSGVAEILRQAPWPTFVSPYSITPQRVDCVGEPSPVTCLNFHELLKFNIWEEIYSCYGSRVISFILNKCLIVQRVEEHLYLCFSHPNSFLCKKIVNEPQYPIRRRLKYGGPCPPPPPVQTNDNDPNSQAVNSHTHIQERNSRENFIVKNPYDDGVYKTGPSSAPHVPKESRKKRKLKRKVILENSGSDSTSKKIKMATNPNEVEVIQESVPIKNVSNSKPGLSSMNPRYIVPSPDILKKIRLERNAQAQSSRPNSENLSDPKTNGAIPTFISILNDKYFKGKLDLITKELHRIKAGAPLSKNLTGLKIPSIYMKPDGEIIELIVHRISETAARKYGLRIKPRNRSRKSIRSTGPVILQLERDAHEPSTSNRSTNQTSNESNDSTRDDPNANCSRTATAGSRPKWSPFCPHISLSTASITYNKLSDTRAPPISQLGQLRTVLTRYNWDCGGKALEQFILNYPVHLHPRSADHTHRTLWTQVEELKSRRKLMPMRRLLAVIPKFHKRVPNLAKLVKTCGSGWILKENQRALLKASERESRNARRQALVSVVPVPGSVPCSNEESPVDLIDLTVDTPSTAEENENMQNNENLHISKNNNHPISLRESGESFRQRKSQRQSEVHFNISTTIQAISQDQNKIRKQLLLSRKLKEKVSFSCVLSIISQVLHLSGASELLGSKYNQRGFIKFIRKSICLAGAHSALQLGQLVSMLNFEHCKWLERIDDPNMKSHIFTKVVIWLFKEYVLIILKIGFYITETKHSRFQLEFYFRDTWKSLTDRVRNRFVQGGKLKIRSVDVSRKTLIPSVTGALRFMPKSSGDVRPILALRNTKITKQETQNINLLLNYISGKVVTSGIRDATDLRNRWVKFLKVWQEQKCPKLYFVRADIRDAYPSVDLELLQSIIQNSVIEDTLIFKEFRRVDVQKHSVSKTAVNPHDANACWHTSIAARPCIIQDNYTDSKCHVDLCTSKLIATLKSHIVKIGRHKYDFSHGLAQGSPLSHALCNIYYGHLDKTHFSGYLDRDGELFVRSVDDYLYISPNPERAAQVFHQLRKGFPDYRCRINRDKSSTNIYVPSNESVLSSEWVTFCGWRFCLTNGHVARDFTSYAGQDSCSTLTFRVNNKTGPDGFIFRRMGMITPLRLKSLILDPVINCRERVLITLFEASLMMAFRFYAACRVLYTSLNALQDPANGYKLLGSISRFATTLNRHFMRNQNYLHPFQPYHCCRNSSCLSSNLGAPLRMDAGLHEPKRDDAVSREEVFFIAYHAFELKLRQHHGVFHKTLLPKLCQLKAKVGQKLDNFRRDDLLNTVGTALPEHFEVIKI